MSGTKKVGVEGAVRTAGVLEGDEGALEANEGEDGALNEGEEGAEEVGVVGMRSLARLGIGFGVGVIGCGGGCC